MPVTASDVHSASAPFTAFPCRRSVVHSTKGIVSCTQPLAAEAGQRILKLGGNAAVSSLTELSMLCMFLRTDDLRMRQLLWVSGMITAMAPPKRACNRPHYMPQN